jgi:hypothetical protein
MLIPAYISAGETNADVIVTVIWLIVVDAIIGLQIVLVVVVPRTTTQNFTDLSLARNPRLFPSSTFAASDAPTRPYIPKKRPLCGLDKPGFCFRAKSISILPFLFGLSP